MKFFNKKVRQAIFAKSYSFYFLIFFFSYLVLNVWINQLYVTRRVLIDNPVFGGFLVLLMLLVAGFVALNINLMIMKFKELKKINRVSGLTAFGVFLGIMGGACPGCLVGLFPVVLGMFGGVGYSLSVLPFNGLELQTGSLLLLIIGARLLSKPSVCKIG